jgi:hypothetical protein
VCVFVCVCVCVCVLVCVRVCLCLCVLPAPLDLDRYAGGYTHPSARAVGIMGACPVFRVAHRQRAHAGEGNAPINVSRREAHDECGPLCVLFLCVE